MGVRRTQRFDRRHNRGRVIGHNADLFEINTHRRQLPCKMIHIGVAGPPRQDFITDHEHGGGWICHGGSPVWSGLL